MKKIIAEEKRECSECYRDIEVGEECYENKYGVAWCSECGELDE